MINIQILMIFPLSRITLSLVREKEILSDYSNTGIYQLNESKISYFYYILNKNKTRCCDFLSTSSFLEKGESKNF
jgi:hypothetical protein